MFCRHNNNNGCPSLPKMTVLCLSWGLSNRLSCGRPDPLGICSNADNCCIEKCLEWLPSVVGHVHSTCRHTTQGEVWIWERKVWFFKRFVYSSFSGSLFRFVVLLQVKRSQPRNPGCWSSLRPTVANSTQPSPDTSARFGVPPTTCSSWSTG